MGFFYRQTGGDEALAADLTQDTFIRVWTARNRFSGSSFHTWLLTIGYNLFKNHYRHSEHEKAYELYALQTLEEASDNNIIDQLDQQTFDQALSRLLEKMPPESRLLFSLRFEEELTIPQIAVVMAVPEGTVKSRLHIHLLEARLVAHEYAVVATVKHAFEHGGLKAPLLFPSSSLSPYRCFSLPYNNRLYVYSRFCDFWSQI